MKHYKKLLSALKNGYSIYRIVYNTQEQVFRFSIKKHKGIITITEQWFFKSFPSYIKLHHLEDCDLQIEIEF